MMLYNFSSQEYNVVYSAFIPMNPKESTIKYRRILWKSVPL